jgi:uncharacterized membrane protein YhaH (DUF805 family)
LVGLTGNSFLELIETKRAIFILIPLLVGILVMYNPLVKRCHDRGVDKLPALIFSIAMAVLAVLGILANQQNHDQYYSQNQYYSQRDGSSAALEVVCICLAIGIIGLFIELYCMPGTIGNNKYGKNPLGIAKAESKSKPLAHPLRQKSPSAAVTKKRNVFARIKGILFSPTEEWAKIAAEEHSACKLFFCWVLPFLAISFAFVCIIVMFLVDNVATVTVAAKNLIIMYGSVVLLFPLVTLFAIACITNFLAPKCGGARDWSRSFALAAYSMTPIFVLCSIPIVGFLLYCIAFPYFPYSFYILCRNIRPMKSIPDDATDMYCTLPVIILGVIMSAPGVIVFFYWIVSRF